MAIRVPSLRNLSYSPGPSLATCTVSAWVQLATVPGSGYLHVIGRGIPLAAAGIGVYAYNGKWSLGDTSSDNAATTGPVAGRWYHVAWTRSGNQDDRLYIDGALVVGPVNLVETGVDPRLLLGVDSWNTGGDGTVLALKCWDAQLTPAELRLEAMQIAPVRQAALSLFAPCLSHTLLAASIKWESSAAE